MIMHKVTSSNIKAIGYEDGIFDRHRILRIEFSHGGIYEYKCVPFEVVENFIKAESLGKFFHKYINNKFDSVRQN